MKRIFILLLMFSIILLSSYWYINKYATMIIKKEYFGGEIQTSYMFNENHLFSNAINVNRYNTIKRVLFIHNMIKGLERDTLILRNDFFNTKKDTLFDIVYCHPQALTPIDEANNKRDFFIEKKIDLENDSLYDAVFVYSVRAREVNSENFNLINFLKKTQNNLLDQVEDIKILSVSEKMVDFKIIFKTSKEVLRVSRQRLILKNGRLYTIEFSNPYLIHYAIENYIEWVFLNTGALDSQNYLDDIIENNNSIVH